MGLGAAITRVANAPAGCPLLSDGTCGDPVNGSYDCALVRECDTATGAVHYEYGLPSGVVKEANVWSTDPVTGQWIWLGPNGTAATPPVGQGKPNTAFSIAQDTPGWFTALVGGKPLPPAPVITTPPPTSLPTGGNPSAATVPQQVASQVPTHTTTQTTTPSTSTSLPFLTSIDTTTSTIVSGVPNVYVYAGVVAVLLFFVMRGKR